MAPRTESPPEPTVRPAPAGRGPLLLKLGIPVVALLLLLLLDAAAVRAVATATLSSPRALLITAGVVALTLGWSALLRRQRVDPWAQSVLVLLPLAVVGGLYIAPYFSSGTVVDDELPVGLVATQPTDTPAEPAAPTGPAEPRSPASPGPEAPAPTAADPTASSDVAVSPVPPEPEPPAAAPAEPAGPVELSRGSFVGLDGHHASGQAAIYLLEDGSQLVRLEGVDLQPVPDPHVYVVPAAEATSPTSGSIDLGPLSGTMGNQNYTVPAEVDLRSGDWTVLVWCEPFASPVGAATQG